MLKRGVVGKKREQTCNHLIIFDPKNTFQSNLAEVYEATESLLHLQTVIYGLLLAVKFASLMVYERGILNEQSPHCKSWKKNNHLLTWAGI